jgi:hypothetical protein
LFLKTFSPAGARRLRAMSTIVLKNIPRLRAVSTIVLKKFPALARREYDCS